MNKEGKPELQILVSFCNPEKALETYKERWQIETAFYDKHIIMQSGSKNMADNQEDIIGTSRFNFA